MLTSPQGAPERPGEGVAHGGAPERPGDGVAHAATNTSGFGWTAVRVSAFTLAAQLIGFGSSIAIARVLGATRATDAYYLALSIPMLVYSIFLTTARQCRDTYAHRGGGRL